MPKKADEAAEQITFMNWANEHGLFAFHIPNGEFRHKATAVRLKLLGVRAGIPDVFVPELKLFIEFKSSTGRPSAAQKEAIAALKSFGYEVVIAKSAEEAIQSVNLIARGACDDRDRA
ncbi:MAG: VRR-NUC domain-containing protein [Thiothrix sp.]